MRSKKKQSVRLEYEYLPVDKAAFDLLVYFERIVKKA